MPPFTYPNKPHYTAILALSSSAHGLSADRGIIDGLIRSIGSSMRAPHCSIVPQPHAPMAAGPKMMEDPLKT